MKTSKYLPHTWAFRRDVKFAYVDLIEQQIRKHCLDTKWCAVTLTMRQGRRHASGMFETVSRHKVSAIVQQYMKSLNIKVYSNAYRRYHKRLLCVPVIEQSKDGRWHVHMLLEVPWYLHDKPERFSPIARDCWTNHPWSRREVDIQVLKTHSDLKRWTKYILKDVPSDIDTIDVENLNIGVFAKPN